MYVIGTGTQDKAKLTLQPEEWEDGVVRLTAHLEPFLMAIRKRWMAEIGVAASHVTVEEKEKRKQETREIKDKNKKMRRRN